MSTQSAQFDAAGHPLPPEAGEGLAAGVEQLDADSTRTRILLKAGPIFARKGFRNATVREICDQAGVNLASVNYYFGDKQQLYNEVVLLARHMRVEEVPSPIWDDSTAADDKLRQFIDMILRRMVVTEDGPWQVQLLMREIQHPTSACRALAREYFRPFYLTLMDVIGEVAGRPLESGVARQLAMSIIGQCMIYRFAPVTRALTMGDWPEDETPVAAAPPMDLSQLGELITEFSLAGIRAASSRMQPPANSEFQD